MIRLLGLGVLLMPMLAWADHYRVDPTHSSVYFAADHLGFSFQRGRFDRLSGQLDINLESKTGYVEIAVETASLSSGNEERDKRLKGSGFFDVEQFPAINFVSQRFDWKAQNLVGVEGELTLLGVTRTIYINVSRFKCGFHLFDLARACGAEGNLSIKRSDFGMDSWLSVIADEVQITLQIEAIHD